MLVRAPAVAPPVAPAAAAAATAAAATIATAAAAAAAAMTAIVAVVAAVAATAAVTVTAAAAAAVAATAAVAVAVAAVAAAVAVKAGAVVVVAPPAAVQTAMMAARQPSNPILCSRRCAARPPCSQPSSRTAILRLNLVRSSFAFLSCHNFTASPDGTAVTKHYRFRCHKYLKPDPKLAKRCAVPMTAGWALVVHRLSAHTLDCSLSSLECIP